MKRDTQGKLAAMFTANMEDEDKHPLDDKFNEVQVDPNLELLQTLLDAIQVLQEGEK